MKFLILIASLLTWHTSSGSVNDIAHVAASAAIVQAVYLQVNSKYAKPIAIGVGILAGFAKEHADKTPGSNDIIYNLSGVAIGYVFIWRFE